MRIFGLIGKTLTHSFSPKFFNKKFEVENILDTCYELFPLENIEGILALKNSKQKIAGLNVTFPYKETIIPFLDGLSETAQKIGAVNTIECKSDGEWIGHNTDAQGFEQCILETLLKEGIRALVLGTGGAAKAVQYVLAKHHVPFQLVSRNSNENLHHISYDELNKTIIENHLLIINCTPIGTFPNINEHVAIPFAHLTKEHLIFDLVYNPEETALMKKAKVAGAQVQNGKAMLINQANASWEIWNSSN